MVASPWDLFMQLLLLFLPPSHRKESWRVGKLIHRHTREVRLETGSLPPAPMCLDTRRDSDTKSDST